MMVAKWQFSSSIIPYIFFSLYPLLRKFFPSSLFTTFLYHVDLRIHILFSDLWCFCTLWLEFPWLWPVGAPLQAGFWDLTIPPYMLSISLLSGQDVPDLFYSCPTLPCPWIQL